ncbi:MAG: M43 family zinc metalloprotease [Bacteroidota bacterium]
MNKRLLIALGVITACCTAFAQTQKTKHLTVQQSTVSKHNHDHRTCGTMEHLEMLKQNNPDLEKQMQEEEQRTQQFIANQKTNPTPQVAYTIPVVFHVVYQNSTENIPDSRLTDQLAVLNQDFKKLNTDWTNTPTGWQSLVADCEITFCLATLDPNGNPTTGITRTQTSVASFNTNDAVKYTAQGGKDIWDRNKYLNIWVCDLGTSLLGYAQFPGGPAATDGVVLNYRYTGTTGSQPPFNRGRTATHEVGHWLNLYHIWGDDGSACTGSDQVSDTPNQAGATGGCYTPGQVLTDACSPSAPGKMWMNYMDYTDDACMYMFTNGQKARIQACMAGTRSALQSSNACGSQQALDAGILSITSPNGSVCAATFTPVVVLRNYGSSTLTTVTITYQVDANPASNFVWTGSLASNAQTNVTLPNVTTTAGNHTFTVCTTAPNSGTDGNTANDCTNSTFTVSTSGTPLPYSQGFESTTFVPTGWTLSNPDGSITWARTTAAAKTGVASAWVDNWSYQGGNGQRDEMTMMPLNLSTVTNPVLTFQVAYTYWTQPYQYSDTLEVLISTNCGSTWSTIYKKWGTQLQTAPPLSSNSVGWVPNNSQWRLETVSLGPYQSSANAIIKFRNITDYEDNLYLDDINIQNTTGISGLDLAGLVSMYPNPANGELHVNVNLPAEETISIRVYDVIGQTVAVVNETGMGGSYTFDLSTVKNGVYFIEVRAGSQASTQKIVVSH